MRHVIIVPVRVVVTASSDEEWNSAIDALAGRMAPWVNNMSVSRAGSFSVQGDGIDDAEGFRLRNRRG